MGLTSLQIKILKILIKRRGASSIADLCRIVNNTSLSLCQKTRARSGKRQRLYYACNECKHRYSSVRYAVKTLEKKGLITIEKRNFTDTFEFKGYDLWCAIKLKEHLIL